MDIRNTLELEKINTNRGNIPEANYQTDDIKVRLISDESEFKSLKNKWNSLAATADVHIFQTHEWQYIWWQHFAGESNRQSLHILLFYQRDQLVGIAPFFVDRFRFMGKTLFQCLRLIGSKVMQNPEGRAMGERTYTDYLDLIIRPGSEKDVSLALLEYIKNTAHYDSIIIEEVPESGSLFVHFIPLLLDLKTKWKPVISDSSVCTVSKLPVSWDHFLKSLSRNARYEVRRYLKRASDKSKKKVFDCEKLTDREKIKDAFDWLVTTHQKRWNDRGRPGIFADRRVYKFYKDVTFQLLECGRVRFQAVSLSGEDRYVAVDLMYQFKDTLYGIHRGFDDSTSYAKYGPGHVSLYTIIQNAIDEGFEKLNLLRGKEIYKSRVANKIIQNKNIILHRNSASKNLSVRLYHLLNQMYALKRKFTTEWTIFKMYCLHHRFFPGISKYRKDLLHRAAERFGN